MDLLTNILQEHSKQHTLEISHGVMQDKQKFRELMNLFLQGDNVVTQRAAWILSHCALQDQKWIRPYIKDMLIRITEPGIHDAAKRNVLKIIQDMSLTEDEQGIAADISFRFLADQQSPVAVKVFAMTVLANIAEIRPDINNELRLMIQHEWPYAGPGFRARAKKIMHKLGISI